MRAVLLLLAALSAVAGLSAISFVQPTFQATVRMKVEKEIPDVESFRERNSRGFDPYWVQDQFEAIQSKAVLFRVITNLGLAQRWGNLSLNEAYPLLKNRLDVRQYRCTSLIEVRFWSKDRQQAADVVNAIATAFRDYKLEQDRATQAAAIAMSEERVRELEREIAEYQAKDDTSQAKLQELKQVRERALLRIQKEKEVPITSEVELIEVASPPQRPIQDPRILGMSLIGLGGILAVLGALIRTGPRIASEAAR